MCQVIIDEVAQLNKLSDLKEHSIDILICKKDVLVSLHSLNEVSAFFKHTSLLLSEEGMYEIELVDVDEMKENEIYTINESLYYLKDDRLWLKENEQLKSLIPLPYIIFQSILLLHDLKITQVKKNQQICHYTVKKVLH